ncbi:MAG: YSC84-related protein [Pseudomonadota bacterium]
MSSITRRKFGFSLAAVPFVAACGNGVGSTKGQEIDARADATMNYLLTNFPASQEVDRKSTGKLIMPLVTEGGLIVGGGYGRGALRVGGATLDYYSATKGSVGLQIGAQQFAHVLWFMTESALADFRRASGWVAGADVEYVFNDQGGNLRADTVTTTAPVVAVVFGQAGALLGASLEGMKYTRIIP